MLITSYCSKACLWLIENELLRKLWECELGFTDDVLSVTADVAAVDTRPSYCVSLPWDVGRISKVPTCASHAESSHPSASIVCSQLKDDFSRWRMQAFLVTGHAFRGRSLQLRCKKIAVQFCLLHWKWTQNLNWTSELSLWEYDYTYIPTVRESGLSFGNWEVNQKLLDFRILARLFVTGTHIRYSSNRTKEASDREGHQPSVIKIIRNDSPTSEARGGGGPNKDNAATHAHLGVRT